MRTRHDAPAPLTAADFSGAFPNSTKVHVDGPHGMRVPFREIALAGGEQPLRVYDSRRHMFDAQRFVPDHHGVHDLFIHRVRAWLAACGREIDLLEGNTDRVGLPLHDITTFTMPPTATGPPA